MGVLDSRSSSLANEVTFTIFGVFHHHEPLEILLRLCASD